MKIYVDNINSKIETDNHKLLKALVDLYTFNVEGAFFTNIYKKGFWDGKKSFISNTGKFKTGLLSRVIKDLEKVNIKPEIVNEQLTIPLASSLDLTGLRPIQVDYLTKALELKRCIIKAPTGFGKTYIIGSIVKSFLDKKILILFNKKQLLVQTYKFLTEECKLPNIGLAFGEGFIESNIMLCTVQSIEKILDLPVEQPDILLVDECHEFCQGKFTTKVISSFPSAGYRIGFTATVPSDNIRRYTLEGALGPVVALASSQEMIEAGYLAKPVIQMFRFKHIVKENISYLDRYNVLIAKNEARNKMIFNLCLGIKHKNPKIAIIVNSLEHAKILNNLIPNSFKIEGKDSIDARNKEIEKFIQNSKYSVLIGTNILQTGINIKEITHLINARGLKTDIPTIQALGRVMRIDKDSVVYVYDFYDEDNNLLEKHSKSRIKAYKKEGHEVELV